MGASKSDLVASLLAGPLESMRAVLFAFPDPLDRLSEDDKAKFAQMLGQAISEAVATVQAADHA
jgi:hypothetical protein